MGYNTWGTTHGVHTVRCNIRIDLYQSYTPVHMCVHIEGAVHMVLSIRCQVCVEDLRAANHGCDMCARVTHRVSVDRDAGCAVVIA
eukprot:7431971-Pyramimonas_sp.AAC.1